MWQRAFAFGVIVVLAACGSPIGNAGLAAGTPSAPPPASCEPGYPALDRNVGAEVAHLKTSATVIEVTSPCTVRVIISGGVGPLTGFTNKTITLRATSQTTYAGGAASGASRLGALGLKPRDEFTLSFDSRSFPDGTYPLNFINR